MLEQGLKKIGFSDEQISEYQPKLEKYVSELELFNAVYDLVGADTHDDIIVRHILDSLAAYKPLCEMFENVSKVHGADYVINAADIGTGGGLPGIPLAIVFPQIHFTLIERMSKRCTFLQNCVAVLQLQNVEVKCLEAERVAQDSFDVVVFRAFRPLEKKMIRVLLRVLHADGNLAAYKARSEKINAEMEGIKQWAPIWQSIPLTVPFLEENERHLVIIPRKQN